MTKISIMPCLEKTILKITLSPISFDLSMYYLSLKIVFILANSNGPDEMPPYVAFHLGLHCLPKHLFTGIKNEKG